jgi:hypothetical protein
VLSASTTGAAVVLGRWRDFAGWFSHDCFSYRCMCAVAELSAPELKPEAENVLAHHFDI